MTAYGMLIDRKACIGCRSCLVACKVNNGLPSGLRQEGEYYRMWPQENELGQFPYVVKNLTLMLCMHCENPPCAEVCAEHAIYQRDDGIVMIDETKCIGCKDCLAACPYGALYWRGDKQVADKCSFCFQNIEQGVQPECVTACPANAIYFGDLDDPDSEINRLIRELGATVLAPQYNTKPRVYYTPQAARLRGRVISKSNGAPLSNIEIKVDFGDDVPKSTLTDDNGTFFYWDLPQGKTCNLKANSFSLEVALNEEYIVLDDIVI